ncbi:MAG TPA: glycosyltransferase family 4 protein [Chthoniobacterales bacterium]
MPASCKTPVALVRRGFSRSGGAEAYLRRLATGLFEKGCEVTLYNDRPWPEDYWPYPQLSLSQGGGAPREFSRAFHRLRNPQEIIFSMERVVGCDIYRAGDGVHAAWLERRAEHEAPIRTFIRRFTPKHRALLELERQVFHAEHTRHIIANSQMVKREITSRFHYPAERVSVIYNGVPPHKPFTQARERVRENLGFSPSDCVVLFAGSGWERKGLRYAIEACRGFPNLTLLVAGRGDAPARPDFVRYLGEVRGMERYFTAADFFLLPTLYDPFSNACLEALAAGLPVITTQFNGVSETLEDGVTGSLVADAAFIPELRRAVGFWMRPENRVPAAGRCRALADRLSLEENTRQTLELILRAGAEKNHCFV